jgi:cytochrome P450
MSAAGPAARRLPPGPKGAFLLGNTFQYLRDPLEFLPRVVREYGDVVRLRLADTTSYLLGSPDVIDGVLRQRADDLIKDRVTRGLVPLTGRGLLTSEGEFWRRQRKLAQPAFGHAQVQRYGEVMVDHTERMLSGWADGKGLDVHDAMMRLTLGIVAQCLFGADVSGEAEVIGHSLETVMEHFLKPTQWFPIRDYLPLPSTIRYRRAIGRIDAIVYRIIAERRRTGHDPGDLLSRLLSAQDDEGGGMTDRQLRDECVTLILAGHETTALVLTYGFFLLAGHPDADARLADELADVLGDRPPTPADVPRLKYAEWVVRESMRLYPPAWAIGREALTDLEVGGYHAPKGTQFFISQWVVHRDPRWFDDPSSFRPERWDDDLARRLPRCAYFPFGEGPRICIGNHFAMMEAILILATIARRFRLSMAPGQALDLAPSITLRPRGPMRVVAEGRTTSVARGA